MVYCSIHSRLVAQPGAAEIGAGRLIIVEVDFQRILVVFVVLYLETGLGMTGSSLLILARIGQELLRKGRPFVLMGGLELHARGAAGHFLA